MKKQFHYYAIRYLSKAMGFSDDVSKLIASVSQFIDDSCEEDMTHKYLKSEVPKEIIKRRLYKEAGDKLIIPVPKTALKTGTEDIVNKELLDEINQLQSLVPFHYYPSEKIDSNSDYYVQPITDLNHHLLKDIFNNSIAQYRKARAKSNDADNMSDDLAASAIYIGVLVHIIADTYSHRYFNGFESYINDTMILTIQENETLDVITNEYPKPADLVKKPQVGCTRVGTTVDDLNVVVVFEQRTDDDPEGFRSGGHTVNTSKAFINAAHMIYKYFLLILGQTDDNEIHWKGMYSKVISEMSKMRGKTDADFVKLIRQKLSKDIECNYDAISTMCYLTDNAALIGEFAIAVDDIRKSIKGGITMEAVKGFKENEDKTGSVTFLPIVMNEEVFTLKIKALYGKIEKGMAMDVNLYDKDTKRKLLSQSFICLERNEIIGEIKNNIPSKKTGYVVSVKVLSTANTIILSDSKEYTIEDENGLMDIAVFDPVSKLVENEIIVVNDNPIDGDYVFSKNATYTTQGQVQALDIFLPVTVTLRVDKDYKINKIYDYKLTLTDNNHNTFMHCGNRKFNSTVIKNDGKGAFIRVADEWKNHIECKSYDKTDATFKLNLWVCAELEYIGDDKDIEGIRKISWSTETIAKDTFLPVTLKWSNDSQTD